MEKKKRTGRFALLIIACLIFSWIPGAFTPVDDLEKHAENAGIFSRTVSLDADVWFAGRENQETSVQKAPVKHIPVNIHHIFIVNVSPVKGSFQEEPFDLRRGIRLSIPHYFNGSKYKGDHAAI